MDLNCTECKADSRVTPGHRFAFDSPPRTITWHRRVRLTPLIIWLLLGPFGCTPYNLIQNDPSLGKDSHPIRLTPPRYLCPLGQGELLRKYFTVATSHQNGPFPQRVIEWRYVLFLPYWHADHAVKFLESDEPVLGSLHRLSMVMGPALRPGTMVESPCNENGYAVEVVDCDVKEFLPSHPYILAAEALLILRDMITAATSPPSLPSP